MTITFIKSEDYNCDLIDVRVRIPAHLSHTGENRFATKAVDGCVADIVKALTEAGIYTDGSCCGHGQADGDIILNDKRILTIIFPEDWENHK